MKSLDAKTKNKLFARRIRKQKFVDDIHIGKPSSSSTPQITRNEGDKINDEDESEVKQSRYGREYKKKVIFDPSA